MGKQSGEDSNPRPFAFIVAPAFLGEDSEIFGFGLLAFFCQLLLFFDLGSFLLIKHNFDFDFSKLNGKRGCVAWLELFFRSSDSKFEIRVQGWLVGPTTASSICA